MFNKTALKHFFPLVWMGWIWINLPIINQKRLTISRFWSLLRIPLAKIKIACRKVTVQFLHLWRYEKRNKMFHKIFIEESRNSVKYLLFYVFASLRCKQRGQKSIFLCLIRASSRHKYLITNYTATSDTLI